MYCRGVFFQNGCNLNVVCSGLELKTISKEKFLLKRLLHTTRQLWNVYLENARSAIALLALSTQTQECIAGGQRTDPPGIKYKIAQK